jgi:hypothetical protein
MSAAELQAQGEEEEDDDDQEEEEEGAQSAVLNSGLRAQLAGLRSEHISPKTRTTYQSSQVRFIIFLANHPQFNDLVSPVLRDQILSQPALARQSILSVLGPPASLQTPPLKFSQLTHEPFLAWIMELRENSSSPVGFSAIRSHRSAFLNLYSEFAQKSNMHASITSELPVYYRSLKRKHAQSVASGSISIKEGKDALSMSNFRWIAGTMQKSRSKEHIFAHCMLTMSWNLICRATNCVNILIPHLSWHEDSLIVQFAQSKTDQTGDNARFPRHVYSNPLDPAICPILSLAIYLLCFPPTGDALFPGTQQYARFSSNLKTLLSSATIQNEASSRGLIVSDIGTHSLRKGAATYVTSGTTVGASFSSVHLRAGWSLGGVLDRYMFQSDAGDNYVGRLVCGLPPTTADFAILPPFFQDDARDLVQRCIDICFPKASAPLRMIAPFLIASVVYHHSFLVATLASDHTLFSSALFASGLRDRLQSHVICRPWAQDDPIKPTGIPPHVSIMSEVRSLTVSVNALLPAIEDLPLAVSSHVATEVDSILETRAIGAGSVTRQGLEQAMRDILLSTGVADAIRTLTSSERAQTTPATAALPQYRLVAGMFRCLPEDFQLPTGTTMAAWQIYCCGNHSKGYPPLCKVTPSDIVDKDVRKRFSEFKSLMTTIKQEAIRQDIWVDNPTIEQSQSIFWKCESVLEIKETTQENRLRRISHLSWTTAEKEVRAAKHARKGKAST